MVTTIMKWIILIILTIILLFIDLSDLREAKSARAGDDGQPADNPVKIFGRGAVHLGLLTYFLFSLA